MAKRTKTLNRLPKLPLAVTVLALVIIAVVLVVGHKEYFWFTPAAAQRQDIQNFFSDADKGNFSSAYKLTSQTFQHNVPYANFVADMIGIKGKNLTVSYDHYFTQNNIVNVNGSIHDNNNGHNLNFGIGVESNQNGSAIDSVLVIPIVSKS